MKSLRWEKSPYMPNASVAYFHPNPITIRERFEGCLSERWISESIYRQQFVEAPQKLHCTLLSYSDSPPNRHVLLSSESHFNLESPSIFSTRKCKLIRRGAASHRVTLKGLIKFLHCDCLIFYSPIRWSSRSSTINKVEKFSRNEQQQNCWHNETFN